MPHIPRRQASTSGTPPEVMYPPADRRPIPVRPPAAKAEDEKKSGKTSIGLPRISIRGHRVDTKQLIETMLGKNTKVDPHTGQLVHDAH